MAAKPGRKFTILEMLVMIAAVAVGLAWSRYYERYVNWEWHLIAPDDEPSHQCVEIVKWWVDGLSYCLVVVSISLFILRVVARPRRRIRHLARSPGLVAGGAVLLTVTLDILYALFGFMVSLREGPFYDSFCEFTYLTISDRNPGLAVAVAWTLLASSARWRREAGWLDGMGIILGAIWILRSLFSVFAEII